MENQSVARDERTTAVENASYRWAYLALSFGLLLTIAYRGFVQGQSNWDLLALVIAAGLIATFYQGLRRILSRRWALLAGFAILVAGAIAFTLVLLRPAP